MKELYTLKKISNHVFGNVPEITITANFGYIDHPFSI